MNNSKRIISSMLGLLMCSALLLSSCSKDSNTSEEKSNLAYKELLNVSYGASTEQTYDAYLPAGRTATTKVLILVHGGGWVAGDKSDNAILISYFTDRGYAVINMNYRLAKAVQDKHPAQIDDVRAVVNMVLAKKDEYAVSDKMAMMGASAGAHLALLYAYAYNDGNHVKAVASMSGPVDFEEAASSTNTNMIAAISYLLGTPYASNPQLWRDASPYYKASASSVPTILFVGSNDPLVYPIQSQRLADKLGTLGVNRKLATYADEGHVWTNPLNWLDMEQQMHSWFSTYVK